MSCLTIGVPVFNGEGFIERALLSLIAQTIDDIEIVVSDNASTDRTVQVVGRLSEQDSRISVIRQESNLGAASNFIALLQKASSPYFAWASVDDLWDADYFLSCVECLRADRSLGFVSGGFASVNLDGRIVRETPSFAAFSSTNGSVRLARFVWEKEALGKANLVHSVFRREVILDACSRAGATFGEWGGDMGIIAAALEHARYLQVPRVKLYKQVSSPADVETGETIKSGRIEDIEFGGAFPPNRLADFRRTMILGLSSRFNRYLVSLLLAIRAAGTMIVVGQQRLRRRFRKKSGT